MSQAVEVREAGVADAEVVASLFSEFNELLGADGLADEEAFLAQHTQVSPQTMAGRLTQMTPVEKTLVAAVEDEPAGLACLRLVPYIGQDVPYAELTQLYVRERFHRRGVGTALISEVERMALDAGATCVLLITGQDNYGAQAFYKTQGYAEPGLVLRKILRREAAHA